MYIDEDQKVMRLKQQNTKEWFNSYLTFQHIKKNFMNLLNKDDRDNMWIPIYDDRNVQGQTRYLLSGEEEILKIVPQENFDFILSSPSEHRNARLFEVKSLKTSRLDRCLLNTV